MNGYIVYHSTDNLNNVHSHGAENLIFRTLDTADRNDIVKTISNIFLMMKCKEGKFQSRTNALEDSPTTAFLIKNHLS